MCAANGDPSFDDAWNDFELENRADRDTDYDADYDTEEERRFRDSYDSDGQDGDEFDRNGRGEDFAADSEDLLQSGFQLLGNFDVNQSFDESEEDFSGNNNQSEGVGREREVWERSQQEEGDLPKATTADLQSWQGSSGKTGDQSGEGDELIEEFQQLWQLAEVTWHSNFGNQGYEHYVAADFRQVYQTLKQLKDRCWTFLEWGSGLGVATIMADRMGMRAYGIEISARLLQTSREIATQFGSNAQFIEGSFIPDDYQWDPEIGDSEFRTPLGGHTAYRSLDVALSDFDIIYAYPWPEETELFIDMMRQCGKKHGYFVTYHATEGIKVSRTKAKR